MQDLDIHNLETYISKPRLRTYRTLAGSTDTKALIGAYLWNKRVASSMYPIFQCLEVSLRNSIHKAATAHFKSADWYDLVTKIAGHKLYQADMKKNPMKVGKFYRSGFSKGMKNNLKLWHSHHENMIKTAKEQLTRGKKPHTPDAVVGELVMGFWIGIFTSAYNDIHSNDYLWPHLLPFVFPHLNSSLSVASVIHNKLEVIKDLRNRLSHHEPVWKHKKVKNAADALTYLNEVVDDAITLIHGICPDRKDLLFKSGKISYFKGICNQQTLNYYLKGDPHLTCDKRSLKRHIAKCLHKSNAIPLIIENKNKPVLVMNLML